VSSSGSLRGLQACTAASRPIPSPPLSTLTGPNATSATAAATAGAPRERSTIGGGGRLPRSAAPRFAAPRSAAQRLHTPAPAARRSPFTPPPISPPMRRAASLLARRAVSAAAARSPAAAGFAAGAVMETGIAGRQVREKGGVWGVDWEAARPRPPVARREPRRPPHPHFASPGCCRSLFAAHPVPRPRRRRRGCRRGRRRGVRAGDRGQWARGEWREAWAMGRWAGRGGAAPGRNPTLPLFLQAAPIDLSRAGIPAPPPRTVVFVLGGPGSGKGTQVGGRGEGGGRGHRALRGATRPTTPPRPLSAPAWPTSSASFTCPRATCCARTPSRAPPTATRSRP